MKWCYCFPSTDKSEETVAQRGWSARLLRGGSWVYSCNSYSLLLATGYWLREQRTREDDEHKESPASFFLTVFSFPGDDPPIYFSSFWHPFLSFQTLSYLPKHLSLCVWGSNNTQLPEYSCPKSLSSLLGTITLLGRTSSLGSSLWEHGSTLMSTIDLINWERDLGFLFNFWAFLLT